MTMTTKEIKAKLDDLKIEYKPQMNKPELLALLEQHLPEELPAKDVETVKFGAMMKVNVKHDGILYKAGSAVDLIDEAVYALFRSRNWIE